MQRPEVRPSLGRGVIERHCEKIEMREKEKGGEVQKVEHNALGIFNKGEGAAGRSDAQRLSMVCSPVLISRCYLVAFSCTCVMKR